MESRKLADTYQMQPGTYFRNFFLSKKDKGEEKIMWTLVMDKHEFF
jgi:hypothetical protein